MRYSFSTRRRKRGTSPRDNLRMLHRFTNSRFNLIGILLRGMRMHALDIEWELHTSDPRARGITIGTVYTINFDEFHGGVETRKKTSYLQASAKLQSSFQWIQIDRVLLFWFLLVVSSYELLSCFIWHVKLEEFLECFKICWNIVPLEDEIQMTVRIKVLQHGAGG